MRICSFLPSATEILFALGLGDDIVGVTHECDYPPQARSKPVVVRSAVDPAEMTSREIDQRVRDLRSQKMDIYAIDSERLQQARPDIIFTQALCDVCALDYNGVVRASQSLTPKPEIVALNPRFFADVLGDIRRVGRVTGREKAAEILLSALKDRVAAVATRARSLGRPRVACIEWLDPMYAAGHWIPEMVELAGGDSGWSEKGAPARRIGWREVVEFSPEVLILMPCGFDAQRALAEARPLAREAWWAKLPAVTNDRVFAVDASAYFSRPGPRLVDGLEILARIIHPELFPDATSPGAARKFR